LVNGSLACGKRSRTFHSDTHPLRVIRYLYRSLGEERRSLSLLYTCENINSQLADTHLEWKEAGEKHFWWNEDWGKQNIGIRTVRLGLVCAQRLSPGCPKTDLLAETYAPVGCAREQNGWQRGNQTLYKRLVIGIF